jgi:hypothetical protein
MVHVGMDPEGNGGLFLGGTPWTGGLEVEPARIVNMTPPDGEDTIDPSTDWENPDNQYLVSIPQRKPFVVRLRFSRPLDPRTVDAAHFTVTKTGVVDFGGNVTSVNIPLAVSVTLTQTRMGEILVTMQPIGKPDPSAVYHVGVSETVRALDGRPLATGFDGSFTTR